MKTIASYWHNSMQKGYFWLLNLSKRPQALWFLFFISFIESSFFLIPPDVMIIPMVLAAPKKIWNIVFSATAGSVLGGYFGYLLGYAFFASVGAPILHFYGYMDKFSEFQTLYNQWGLWIVLGAGFTPFPYKIITIASGVMHLDLWLFGFASLLSRGGRFFIVAWLIAQYGESMKIFIEKHLGILSIVFFILLFGSFALIKLF